jgi:hypothetical protein
MDILKKCLEQIVHIAENEAYDEQARVQMKQWALVALKEIQNANQ